MPMLTALIIALMPFVTLAVLLLISTRLARVRAARLTSQVALTDAIHRELGAVVAPVIEPRAWRRPRLRIAVPFESPALVGRVVALADEALRGERAGSTEIVLVPQRQSGAAAEGCFTRVPRWCLRE
jgi:hypothetical protein